MEQQQIYKSLAAIMKSVTAIGKNSRNEVQKFNFRGIDDVMNELHTLFADNGVVLIPVVLDITKTERTGKTSVLLYSQVKVEYRFVAADGSSVSSIVYGEAMDSGDKATNKAMSAALKYCLTQMFLVPTKDMRDADAESHDVRPQHTAQNAHAQRNVQQQPQHKPSYQDMLAKAVEAANRAQCVDELTAVWNSCQDFHKEESFVDVVKTRGKALRAMQNPAQAQVKTTAAKSLL